MFHEGQEVICVRTHKQGIVVKGEIYIVKGTKKGCCFDLVNVGKTTEWEYQECSRCGGDTLTGGYCWIHHSLFAPISRKKVKHSCKIEFEIKKLIEETIDCPEPEKIEI